jgi:Collagen triple helix repeat (20 copies)
MQAMQVLSQVVAALVAAVGATGYIILLGAAVLWVRLHEGFFPKEVPISYASREELLVMGAQALAVWVVLAIALTVLASRLVASETVTNSDMAADIAFGFSVSVVALAWIEGAETWTIWVGVAFAAVAAVIVVVAAFSIRPPVVAWVAALVPAAVGIAMPVCIHLLDDTKTTPTVLTAWATFAVVLIWFPTMRAQRQRIAANTAAISSLELEHPELRPQSEIAVPKTVARLAAAIRAQLRQARVRLWLRAALVGLAGLLTLGIIAVASQFDRLNMFQGAVASLKDGRCLEGTYLARNNDQLVLGDQQRLELAGKQAEDDAWAKNRVIVIPAAQVLDLQVTNPVGVGLPLTTRKCGDLKSPPPSKTENEPQRQGLTAAPKSPSGSQSESGPSGPQGRVGPQGPGGAQGPAGARGPAGAQGPTGPQGPAGAKGVQGATGPRGPSDRDSSRGG